MSQLYQGPEIVGAGAWMFDYNHRLYYYYDSRTDQLVYQDGNRLMRPLHLSVTSLLTPTLPQSNTSRSVTHELFLRARYSYRERTSGDPRYFPGLSRNAINTTISKSSHFDTKQPPRYTTGNDNTPHSSLRISSPNFEESLSNGDTNLGPSPLAIETVGPYLDKANQSHPAVDTERGGESVSKEHAKPDKIALEGTQATQRRLSDPTSGGFLYEGTLSLTAVSSAVLIALDFKKSKKPRGFFITGKVCLKFTASPLHNL